MDAASRSLALMKRSNGFALALLLGAGLAACSGGGNSGPSGGSCVKPTAPQLLYPIPGSTAVPDTLNVVIYAGNGQSDTITLFNGGVEVATTPTTLPTTLPSPMASPTNPAAPIIAITFQTLSVATTYDVRYALPAPCNPTTASMGGFVTQ
jgi:hypothetical protein